MYDLFQYFPTVIDEAWLDGTPHPEGPFLIR